MATSTKRALADALRQMMEIKPINKITVKDLVDICNVNRQTFYYHFDDVYDLLEWVFEEDANRSLPKEVTFENWQRDVMAYFEYLYNNAAFSLNVYNSDSRLYMLRYIKGKLQGCIRSFADIVCEGKNIDKQDYDFAIEMYANIVVGVISQWMDMNMQIPKGFTKERLLALLEGSVENIMERFQKN